MIYIGEYVWIFQVMRQWVEDLLKQFAINMTSVAVFHCLIVNWCYIFPIPVLLSDLASREIWNSMAMARRISWAHKLRSNVGMPSGYVLNQVFHYLYQASLDLFFTFWSELNTSFFNIIFPFFWSASTLFHLSTTYPWWKSADAIFVFTCLFSLCSEGGS